MFQHKLIAANYNDGARWVYERLEQWLASHDVAFELAMCQTEDEVIERAQDCDMYLAFRFPVTRHIIENLPKLKLLMSSGSGYDHIDVDAATEQGITVTNTALYNVEDVAEFALLLIMAGLRKLRQSEQLVRQGHWQVGALVQPTHRNTSRTVGLIGFGNIGQALAWRLHALGFAVLAYDPYVPDDVVRAKSVKPVSLDELLQTSDVVSPHLRVTDDTNHLLNAAAFDQMKPSAIVVNSSRGQIIDEAALLHALQSEKIAGAALDVLEEEPPDPNNPLLAMDNVIVSGHAAGSTAEGIEDWQQEWRQIILAYLAGEPTPNMINTPA